MEHVLDREPASDVDQPATALDVDPAWDADVAAARDPIEPTSPRRRPPSRLGGALRAVGRTIARGLEWCFGVISLVLGLSILAAIPIAQFLCLGYMLEAAARVAITGRLRDGLIGVRRAARVGGVVAGAWISMLPLWLAGSAAYSAAVIDPGGPSSRAWRVAMAAVALLTCAHLGAACARGGRLRYFLWPFGNPLWLARRLRRGGLYVECRDGLWDFVVALHLPNFFKLGLVGFLGTTAWLVVPATLIIAGARFPICWPVGLILLAIIVPFLPFLQIRYAVEGDLHALFSRRAIRSRFRNAPWAFAFALVVLLIASVPLYLLKIEFVPREAAWLPSLLFVIFLAPARLLTGWAYHRAGRRRRPRHWLFRILGRVAILAVALFYVLIVFLAQYTSWGGVRSLYEQHAFSLPVPFLNL